MFLLLVRHKDWTETLEFSDWDSLIRDAADHEAENWSGKIVGAVELVFKHGELANCITRTDLWSEVYAELKLNPAWQRIQENAARWSDRHDQH